MWNSIKAWFARCARWYCRFWHSEKWILSLDLGQFTIRLSSKCPKCGREWPRDMMTIREAVRIGKWSRERGMDAKDLLALLPPKKDREKVIKLGINKTGA